MPSVQQNTAAPATILAIAPTICSEPERRAHLTPRHAASVAAASMRAREIGLPTPVEASRSDVQTIRLMPPQIRREGAREAEGHEHQDGCP
jgi:hypothetical protein